MATHHSAADVVAWRASLDKRLTDLVEVYQQGLDERVLAEVFLSHFVELAERALAAGGANPTAHAVRALADRLLAERLAS